MGQEVRLKMYQTFGSCKDHQLRDFLNRLDQNPLSPNRVVRETHHRDSYHQIDFSFGKYRANISLSQKRRPSYQRVNSEVSSHIYGALIMLKPQEENGQREECFIHTADREEVFRIAKVFRLNDEMIFAQSK
jgi:hypothetical protein